MSKNKEKCTRQHALFSLMGIFISLLISSCSTFQSGGEKKKELQKEKLEMMSFQPPLENAEEIDLNDSQAEKKLAKMTAKAQKIGGKAPEYLASDLYLKASDASNRGELKIAVMLMKHVIKLMPDEEYLKRKYAVDLIRLGELKEAEKHLLSIYEGKKKTDENLGLILGGIYTALSQAQKARDIYQEIREAHPKNREACLFLSKSFALEQKYHAAKKTLNDCQEEIGQKAVFSFYMGRIAIDENEKEKAKKHFRSALKKDDTFSQAALALGSLFEEKENWEKASDIYRGYLENNPYNSEVLSRLVEIMFSQAKYNEIIPYLERLVSIEQGNYNLKMRLGILYSENGQHQKALDEFEEILEAYKDSDKVMYIIASTYQELGRNSKARKYFSRVSAESPLYTSSVEQIAKMLGARARQAFLEDSKGAQEKVEKFKNYVGQKLSTSESNLRVRLAYVLSGFYEFTSEYNRALDTMEEVRGEKAFDRNDKFYLASLMEKNDEVDRARKIIRRILEKDPESARAHNYLGYSMLESGDDLDKAYTHIKKAAKLEPKDPYIQDSVGWYFYKKGNLKRALKEIKKAWEKASDDMVITKHLAIIYKEMKEYAKAKKYYVEALKLTQTERERKELLSELEELENIRLPASSKESGPGKEAKNIESLRNAQ